MLPPDHVVRMERARAALAGLSIGDAFGERFFVNPGAVDSLIEQRAFPAAPWRWTDDTAMALSIVEVLETRGTIDSHHLADAFARRYRNDPGRGYGGGAHQILQALVDGVPWTAAARMVFDGAGSMGNGGGMRSAPVGAYFADDLDRVVAQARASAQPTHAHPDGQAGAIAVAVATALAAGGARGAELLDGVLARTPEGLTRERMAKAVQLPLSSDARKAAALLGNGAQVCSHDTVPFALWCAARHLDDFEEALWTTVSALGDRDTTCAIAGGIVVMAVGLQGIPESFMAAREPIDGC
jgi:ADP-ribosylglycohydrolase